MHTLSGIVIWLKMSSAVVTIARDCVAITLTSAVLLHFVYLPPFFLWTEQNCKGPTAQKMPSERKYMEFKLGYSGLFGEEAFAGEFCNYSFLPIT